MVKPSGSTVRSKNSTPPPPDDRETRERILDAAHAVFLRKGTAGSRTQEIADDAGVNKALVHYYFGTKAALADAVFERELATLAPL
ncbi:MAG TPA: TetR/AcrR family transcriptional regulator, partial [Gemmatimonadales bacterium]